MRRSMSGLVGATPHGCGQGRGPIAPSVVRAAFLTQSRAFQASASTTTTTHRPRLFSSLTSAHSMRGGGNLRSSFFHSKGTPSRRSLWTLLRKEPQGPTLAATKGGVAATSLAAAAALFYFWSRHDSRLHCGGDQTTSSSEVVEESTGLSFPLRLPTKTQSPAKEQTMLAVGVRYVLWTIKAYAVALYLDLEQMENEKRSSPKLDLLLDPNYRGARTLRFAFHRDDSSTRLIRGFVEACLKRWKSSSPEEQETRNKAFDDFAVLFPVTLRQGMTMDFEWRGGDELVMFVDGKEAGSVKSAPLARAFFDTYLGEEAKLPRLKKEWENELNIRLSEKHK
ncbi:hypothetical protein QOT17_007974 [Balamuthia mandrillaris]